MGNGLVNVQTMPGDLYVGHLEDIRPDLKGRREGGKEDWMEGEEEKDSCR